MFLICFNEYFLKISLSRSSRPEVFCKKGVLRNFAKFTGKQLCQSLFFNKVAGLRHRYFPVKFAKFLRTSFFTEHLRWLLLNVRQSNSFAGLNVKFRSHEALSINQSVNFEGKRN